MGTQTIVKGLYKTGHIITAAGIIMAVAFSGLLIKLIDHIESSSLLLGCGCSFGYFYDQNYLSSSSSWIYQENMLGGLIQMLQTESSLMGNREKQ